MSSPMNMPRGHAGGERSGRNTPTHAGPLGHTGSPHRAVLSSSPFGRPAMLAHSASAVLSDEEEESADRGTGWRPITPSRQHQQQHLPASINDDFPLNHGHSTAVPPSDSYAQAAEAGSGQVKYANLPPVLKGYLLGQIACVLKFGIWWVGFTYLILALFGGNSYLVGATRICFNLALLICSPMAGAIAEKTNIKKLLNKTVIGRGIIYALAIPISWTLMESGLLWNENSALHSSFFAVFLLIIFIDGIGVSFSNVADIDSGGVNLVAAQYNIEIDDNVRNYFNSLHIMFFDLSMVIFNPILAYAGLLIGEHTVAKQADRRDIGNVVDEVTLLIAIGGVFLVSTIVTLVCYNAYMPNLRAPHNPLDHSMQTFDADPNVSMNSSASVVGSGAEPEGLSWAQFKELAASVREGASLTWANSRIRWRVLFFAVETSVEDAMIALIAAEIGSQLLVSGDTNLHYAWGNLWGAGLVACGKLGGVFASFLMHRYFTTDTGAADPSSAYRPLFWFAFIGGVCSLILPLAHHLREHNSLSQVAFTTLTFVGMFLFFIFSTLSKIGFSTLMQSMAAEVEATGRVFGFVAAFVTATDALILMGLSALFSACTIEVALWVSCAFIATHGLIELVFGPGLVLKAPPPSLDDQLRMDLAQPLYNPV